MLAMRNIAVVALAGVNAIVGSAGWAQQREYTATKASGPIVIDGKGDDAAWQQAPDSPRLVVLRSGETPPAAIGTTFKVLYD
ncbi:MAG: hypothetical protein PHR35_18110, partial [Kiritimatiellae bacterium]|nr:hypothetical protein [Kiritimatiellia bacterium]